MRGQSPWRSRQSRKRGWSGSLSRNAAQATAPLHGATPTDDVTASRVKTGLLRHRRSAVSRNECAVGARMARRDARVLARQHKMVAPFTAFMRTVCDILAPAQQYPSPKTAVRKSFCATALPCDFEPCARVKPDQSFPKCSPQAPELETMAMIVTPDRIVRIKTVLNRTGLSRSTLYRKIQDGTFPRQLKINVHSAGWSEAAINAWVANPVGYRADPEIR
jgi:prophage regulatory protein